MKAKKFIEKHDEEMSLMLDVLDGVVEFAFHSTLTPPEVVGALEFAKQQIYMRGIVESFECEE